MTWHKYLCLHAYNCSIDKMLEKNKLEKHFKKKNWKKNKFTSMIDLVRGLNDDEVNSSKAGHFE